MSPPLVIGVLEEHHADISMADISRKHRISNVTRVSSHAEWLETLIMLADRVLAASSATSSSTHQCSGFVAEHKRLLRRPTKGPEPHDRDGKVGGNGLVALDLPYDGAKI
jgi:hypothetical protein